MKKINGINLVNIFVLLIAAVLISGCTSNAVKEQQQTSQQSNAGNFKPSVEIVNGVQIARLSWGKFNYEPAVIKLKSGMQAKIVADTDRLQGCFRSISIPDLGLQKSFDENDNTLEFTPQKTGTFAFGCAMGMGSGTLIVE